MNFLTTLNAEFAARRQRNPRYSLRAFARYLGMDHATLSQIMRRRRNLSPRTISRIVQRLHFAPGLVSEARLQQNEDAILRLAQSPAFRTDSRWIATRTNLPLDAVNIALQRLLHHGHLVMISLNRWKINSSSYA